MLYFGKIRPTPWHDAEKKKTPGNPARYHRARDLRRKKLGGGVEGWREGGGSEMHSDKMDRSNAVYDAKYLIGSLVPCA